ncbi:MAG: hypothetical protein VSS75_016210, partial [Candidatus Parabeggiatoa sp.]|nr:hypothetical protein [Candidatus Parabeggiatoa sp.]
DDFILRFEKAGFGYLLKEHVLKAAHKAQRISIKFSKVVFFIKQNLTQSRKDAKVLSIISEAYRRFLASLRFCVKKTLAIPESKCYFNEFFKKNHAYYLRHGWGVA